ncbi:MAG: pentapeptide repeat-containing protein [candidate division WOR-3 bacterium]
MRATFSERAYFSEATFSGGAYFLGATFSGGANFSGATFSGPLLFHETIIKGECIFKQTDFLASAVFERCKLNEGKMILDSAFMAEPEKVNFSLFDENAQHLAFVNISVNTLRGIGFVGMNFLRDGRIYTEDYLKTQGDYSDSGRLNKAGLELALSAYRGLRLNYEDNGLFPEARHFYIREMELKRELEIYPNYWLIKDFWKNFCSYIGLLWVYGVWHGHFWRWVRYEVFSLQSWYHRISSCGESYRKAFVWLMGLYLVCGILYWIGGLTVRDRGETFAANPFIFSLKSLIPGFYMILGVPENPWKAALMFAEGVLGLVIITLFLLAVRRRFKR